MQIWQLKRHFCKCGNCGGTDTNLVRRNRCKFGNCSENFANAATAVERIQIQLGSMDANSATVAALLQMGQLRWHGHKFI